MVNGLGGTPISELYIVYGRAAQKLADGGINVTRSYVGEYCTSLDMAGASITLVKLDKELNDLFDAPAEVAVRIFYASSTISRALRQPAPTTVSTTRPARAQSSCTSWTACRATARTIFGAAVGSMARGDMDNHDAPRADRFPGVRAQS
jgi:hypothetical protein